MTREQLTIADNFLRREDIGITACTRTVQISITYQRVGRKKMDFIIERVRNSGPPSGKYKDPSGNLT